MPSERKEKHYQIDLWNDVWVIWSQKYNRPAYRLAVKEWGFQWFEGCCKQANHQIW